MKGFSPWHCSQLQDGLPLMRRRPRNFLLLKFLAESWKMNLPHAGNLNWDPGTFIVEVHVGVSKNRGTPKSSILIGFSLINHPFWGFSPYFWKHPCSMPTRQVCM